MINLLDFAFEIRYVDTIVWVEPEYAFKEDISFWGDRESSSYEIRVAKVASKAGIPSSVCVYPGGILSD
jgi:hypothetical protein